MSTATCSAVYSSPFIRHFNRLEDPRRISKGNLKHSLTDIIFLVIAVVVRFETRYYISSLSENAGCINKKIRDHWGIENKFHMDARCEFWRRCLQKKKGPFGRKFQYNNQSIPIVDNKNKRRKKDEQKE